MDFKLSGSTPKIAKCMIYMGLVDISVFYPMPFVIVGSVSDCDARKSIV